MKQLFPAVLAAVLLYGCGTDAVYEKSADVANRHWIADSVYTFEFNVDENSAVYNLFFTVRNTSEYPFYNLYAIYNLQDSTGRTLSGEMVNFELFHPKTGEPYGGGLGSIYSHKLPLISETRFPYPGKYLITLGQNMRLDSLPGIVSVGISVESAEGAQEE